nr:hypothetical protein RFYW14_00166 [Pseudorhizobium flavum]
MRLRFDPLCHHPQSEIVGNSKQAFDDDEASISWDQTIGEGFIYLDDVHRKRQQVCEGRVACPEIVKRHPQSHLTKRIDFRSNAMITLTQIDRFRHFQDEVM